MWFFFFSSKTRLPLCLLSLAPLPGRQHHRSSGRSPVWGLHPPRSPEEVLGRVDPRAPVLLRHWEHTPGLCPKWEVLCRKSSTLRVMALLIALTSSWTLSYNFFFLYFLIVKRLMHLQDLNGKILGVVSPVPQHKLQSLSHQQVKGSLVWCGSCISRSWSWFEWKLWSLEPVAGQSQEDLP